MGCCLLAGSLAVSRTLKLGQTVNACTLSAVSPLNPTPGCSRTGRMCDLCVDVQVHESIKNVNSLAKETQQLEFCKDPSGATTINQYVVVKALGQGSFGKVGPGLHLEKTSVQYKCV